jgi:hypothetical protein
MAAFPSRPLAECHNVGRFSKTAFHETPHETLLKRSFWYTVAIIEFRWSHEMRAHGTTH